MEPLTDVGDDSGQDNLLAAGGVDGSPEVSVVPCVDLARSLDQSCVGVHVEDLSWKRAVGA